MLSIVCCCIFQVFLGCYQDVLNIVDNSCSGRQSCEFAVGSNLDERDDLSPCPEGLKMYLEASYQCLQGMCAAFLNETSLTRGCQSIVYM